MGPARAVDLPVFVVGYIDRGGVPAAMYGTLALLDEADQAHIRGWGVNKFRGDLSLLGPSLRMIEERIAAGAGHRALPVRRAARWPERSGDIGMVGWRVVKPESCLAGPYWSDSPPE